MKALRWNVQDSPRPVSRPASCLLDDKGQRVCLVEQPQLSAWILHRRGIQVDSSLQQVSVKIGHKTANVARLELSVLAVAYIRLYPWVPFVFQALIDGIDGTGSGCLDIRMGKKKLSQTCLVGEAVGPVAGSIDQHRGCTVQHISRRNLLPARLHNIFLGNGTAYGRPSPIDREDRSDADVINWQQS